MKNVHKGFASLAIAIIIALFLGVGGYVAVKQQENKKSAVTFSVTGNNLSVVKDGKTTQTLSLGEQGIFALNVVAGNNPPAFITDKDVNFDGHNDVGVLASTGYAGVNYFYDFYIFNPITGQLEKNDVLNGIVLTSIDPVNKQITSTYKSGTGYTTDVYQWDGSSFKLISPSATATSDWKTYTNEKYGFEFKYPADWKTIDSISSNAVLIEPPLKNQPAINVSVSNGMMLSPFKCPFSTHEVECKIIQNQNSVSYIRAINTGQLTKDKHQQLSGFFESSKTSVQFAVTLTDVKGNSDPLSSKTVEVFDQILSTLKFTK